MLSTEGYDTAAVKEQRKGKQWRGGPMGVYANGAALRKSHLEAYFRKSFPARSARREFRHFRNRHKTAYTLPINPSALNTQA